MSSLKSVENDKSVRAHRKKTGAVAYRYGFNGKENDNEVKGGDGLQQDYGMRVYDPRLGKFLSVDPLKKLYPWYTPYQFAGNKPIWAIDLDGMEEEYSTINYETGGEAISIVQEAFVGLQNMFARAMELQISDETEGKMIRKVLTRDGHKIGSAITNKDLGKNFKFNHEVGRMNVVPESGILSDLMDVGLGAMTVASFISPGPGGAGMIGMTTGGVVRSTVTDVLRQIQIIIRKKVMIQKFINGANGKPISDLEAQSGAILEEAMGLELKSVALGESHADYIVKSGYINGVNAAGKYIDQFGIPTKAMEKFKMKQFLESVDSHFQKIPDYLLLDLRNFNKDQQKVIMDHINENHAKKAEKLITIGLIEN